MTLGIKDMIARCIARMRQNECATCDNRDSCAIHKMGAFAPPQPDANPLASLLGGDERVPARSRGADGDAA